MSPRVHFGGRLVAITALRFVTPAEIAAGRTTDGYRVTSASEELLLDTVDSVAERLDEAATAYEIEAEIHRDTDVVVTDYMHSDPEFDRCKCREALDRAKGSTRSPERSRLGRVWLVEPERRENAQR